MGKRFLPTSIPELVLGAGRSGCPIALSPCPAHPDRDPRGCEGLRVPRPCQVKLPAPGWELSETSQLQAPSSPPGAIPPSPAPAPTARESRPLLLACHGRAFPSARASHPARSPALTLVQEAQRAAPFSVTPFGGERREYEWGGPEAAAVGARRRRRRRGKRSQTPSWFPKPDFQGRQHPCWQLGLSPCLSIPLHAGAGTATRSPAAQGR